MSMFPPDWEVALSIDRLPEACPYSLAEIGDYLVRCHHHLLLDEGPTTFQVGGPHAQFEARDAAKQRQWFVVVGTGKSFANPSEKLKRWMWAKTNDEGLSPDEFLDEEYREQLEHDDEWQSADPQPCWNSAPIDRSTA
jgi:hypothetical protein